MILDPLNSSSSDEGLLFVATGSTYLEEAFYAARASKSFLGDHPIAIVTDLHSECKSMNIFDLVLPHPCPIYSYRDKIPPLLNLPWRKTLFLDTDACLTSEVDSIFSSLGHSHLAAAFAPVRHPSGWNDSSVPLLFPEINSGVLLLRRSFRQRMLVKKWLKLYDQLFFRYDQSWDQASLRSVIWDMKKFWWLRFSNLPAEANLRLTKPWVAGKGLAVHVIHGRVPPNEFDSFLQYLNGDIDRFRHWHEWLTLYPDSALRPKISPQPTIF